MAITCVQEPMGSDSGEFECGEKCGNIAAIG